VTLPSRYPSNFRTIVGGRLAGTFHGWWVAFAVSLAGLANLAFVNPVLSVFFEPLHDEFGWSRGAIAGALSGGTLLGAVISPFVGRLLDRHGARVALALSALVMGLSLIILALSNELWQFYMLYGLGRALVIGVVGLASTVTLANWFIRSRGRATAIVLLGGRLGMALGPPFALLMIGWVGWRGAFIALGLVALLVGVLPAWLLISRRPEDVGLRPDGDREPSVADAAEIARLRSRDPLWSTSEALRTPAFWLLTFGTAQIFAVSGAVNLSIIPHLQDRGLSSSSAVSVATVWAFCGMAGGMLGGALTQRFFVRFPLAITMVASAVGLAWLTVVDGQVSAYAFAVYQGITFGAQMSLNQVVLSEYFGRWSVGAISGLTQPVQWILGAAGPVVASVSFDVSGSYASIFAIYVGLLMLGGVLIALAKQPVATRFGAPAPSE
jgi:MFS family permease